METLADRAYRIVTVRALAAIPLGELGRQLHAEGCPLTCESLAREVGADPRFRLMRPWRGVLGVVWTHFAGRGTEPDDPDRTLVAVVQISPDIEGLEGRVLRASACLARSLDLHSQADVSRWLRLVGASPWGPS